MVTLLWDKSNINQSYKHSFNKAILSLLKGEHKNNSRCRKQRMALLKGEHRNNSRCRKQRMALLKGEHKNNKADVETSIQSSINKADVETSLQIID